MQAIDLSIVEWFAHIRSPLGIVVAFVASDIGSTATIAALAVVFAVWLAHKRHRFLLPFLIAIAGAFCSFEWLKDWTARPRPPYALEAYHPLLYSFPSGHATMAAVFFGFAAYALALRQSRHQRHAIYIAAAAIIVLIGLSRLYLGVHYASDILAGWLLGFAWMAFGIRMIPKRSTHA